MTVSGVSRSFRLEPEVRHVPIMDPTKSQNAGSAVEVPCRFASEDSLESRSAAVWYPVSRLGLVVHSGLGSQPRILLRCMRKKN